MTQESHLYADALEDADFMKSVFQWASIGIQYLFLQHAQKLAPGFPHPLDALTREAYKRMLDAWAAELHRVNAVGDAAWPLTEFEAFLKKFDTPAPPEPGTLELDGMTVTVLRLPEGDKPWCGSCGRHFSPPGGEHVDYGWRYNGKPVCGLCAHRHGLLGE